MIIFDLDGTLADCEHRRHFVDPKKNSNYKRRWDATLDECINNKCIPEEYIPVEITKKECLDCTYKKFKPDWQAFYEACDKDEPIESTIKILHTIMRDNLAHDDKHFHTEIQIWSGRCESVRARTNTWLMMKAGITDLNILKNLKMRPIGDSTPDDVLKEKWLDEALKEGKNVEFVFDDRPNVVRMWRRRGVFVFDVNQSGEEF